MENEIKTHIENPIIIKDMKKYLWNPENMKDLYETLTALPKEEFYDLHPEELRQVNILYSEMRQDRSKHDSDISWKLWNIVRLKLNIENTIGGLANAVGTLPVQEYFMGEDEENEKQIAFEKQIKKVFSNLVLQLNTHKKNITPDGVDHINHKVIERMRDIQRIDSHELAELLSYILQKQIYTENSEIDTALRWLMEIHGEDIDRPLLWGNSMPEEYTWLSLVFMKYGFGKIDIDEVLEGIDKNIKQNNETIQHSIKPFIPLYGRLRSVLEETKDEEETGEELIPFETPKSLKDIGTIDVKKIEEHAQKNKYLRTIRKCDKTLLTQKLQILRDICDLSNAEQKMIQE